MNIYDIAKLSGVSIATVSRVVNGSVKVSEKTKAKVLEVMSQVQYTPNVFARGLGLGSMRTIAIICPDISDEYMAKAISVLERQLHSSGYDSIVGCSGFKQEDKEHYVEWMLSKKVDALVMVGSTYSGDGGDSKQLDYLKEAATQVPLFIVNGYVPGENIFCVNADDFKAMYDSTTLLLKKGRSQILFLYNSESYSAKQKKAGYLKALLDFDFKENTRLQMYSENKIHHTRDLLLSKTSLFFDGVVAAEDGLAIGALKYAKATNKAVPGDISIIGYNNLPLSLSCDPELTTVDSNIDLICRLTAENLVRVLHGDTEVKHNTTVPGKLVIRGTAE